MAQTKTGSNSRSSSRAKSSSSGTKKTTSSKSNSAKASSQRSRSGGSNKSTTKSRSTGSTKKTRLELAVAQAGPEPVVADFEAALQPGAEQVEGRHGRREGEGAGARRRRGAGRPCRRCGADPEEQEALGALAHPDAEAEEAERAAEDERAGDQDAEAQGPWRSRWARRPRRSRSAASESARLPRTFSGRPTRSRDRRTDERQGQGSGRSRRSDRRAPRGRTTRRVQGGGGRGGRGGCDDRRRLPAAAPDGRGLRPTGSDTKT